MLTVVSLLLSLAPVIIGGGILLGFPFALATFLVIAALVALWPMMSISARRCHDLGISGKYVILLLVPGINLFFLGYLLFKLGEPRDNAWGSVPSTKVNLRDWDKIIFPLQETTQQLQELNVSAQSQLLQTVLVKRLVTGLSLLCKALGLFFGGFVLVWYMFNGILNVLLSIGFLFSHWSLFTVLVVLIMACFIVFMIFLMFKLVNSEGVKTLWYLIGLALCSAVFAVLSYGYDRLMSSGEKQRESAIEDIWVSEGCTRVDKQDFYYYYCADSGTLFMPRKYESREQEALADALVVYPPDLCSTKKTVIDRWHCVGNKVEPPLVSIIPETRIDHVVGPYATPDSQKIAYCKTLTGIRADYCYASIVQYGRTAPMPNAQICANMSDLNPWFKADCFSVKDH
jgi:hypothetical protein